MRSRSLPALASLASVLNVVAASSAFADVVYQQPPLNNGQFYHSARWGEDGSDYDEYVWDSFTLGTTRSISEIHWRGGYVGATAPITQFEISIWGSIPAGSQPNIGAGPIVEYTFVGNAGQTPAGTVGSVTVYDYGVTLPVPFVATAGVKYWVEILAWQNGFPFWSLQAASGGNGSHFRFSEGMAMFHMITGDCAFSLVALPLPCPADIDGSGTVDAADLSLLLGSWGSAGAGDLNASGTVDAADLSILLGAWGSCG
jgi:hypothetical protein